MRPVDLSRRATCFCSRVELPCLSVAAISICSRGCVASQSLRSRLFVEAALLHRAILSFCRDVPDLGGWPLLFAWHICFTATLLPVTTGFSLRGCRMYGYSRMLFFGLRFLCCDCFSRACPPDEMKEALSGDSPITLLFLLRRGSCAMVECSPIG